MPARSLPLQRNLCTMKQNRTKEDKVKCQSLLIRIRYMNRLSGNTNWQDYKKSTYYSISRKITSFEYKRIDTLSFYLAPLLDSGCVLALECLSAAKIYRLWLAWASGGGCYTCALLTSDKETFQPTRVTEQRSLKHRLEGIQGLKQANMAACNWCPYTHNALPAKNTPIWLVHGTGPSGTGAHHVIVANIVRLVDLLFFVCLVFVFPVWGAVPAFPIGNELCSWPCDLQW